jgi:hypothetical protein
MQAENYIDIFSLLPLPLQEFEYWLKRNPKILDSLLSFKTAEKVCTLGPLIMSPSEQLFSASESQAEQLAGAGQGRQGGGTGEPGTPVEVVTRRAAASPTLFQIGGPSLEGEEEREEGEKERGEGEMEQESSLKLVGNTACR